MLDAALVEIPGGSRLIVLDDSVVVIYRRKSGSNPAGRWELETSVARRPRARLSPRFARTLAVAPRSSVRCLFAGNVLPLELERDAPLMLTCNNSDGQTYGALTYDALTYDALTYDDPWPLTPEEGSVRPFSRRRATFLPERFLPALGKV